MSDRRWNLVSKLTNAVLLSLTALFCLFSTTFAVAQIAISPATESYGNVVVNTSAGRHIGVKNYQAVPLTISQVLTGSGFAIDSSTTCTATLAPAGYCVIGVTFTPTALTSYSGNVAITTSAGNQTIPLSGTGTPQIAISPATENYGNVVMNTSAGRHIGITNYQTTALTTSWSLSGSGFTIDPSTTCTATLAPSSYCVIGVTFTPTALTSYSGNVAITTSAGNQTIPLSGTGTPQIAISPATENYGNVVMNTSAGRHIGITNYQAVPLTISQVLTGSGFAIDSSTTCTATLAPSSYCVIGVTFAPTAAAAYSGNVAITTSAGSQTVTLSGTGTPQIAISPATENYGNVVVNTSAGRHIGVTNYQAVPLTISQVLTGSGFAIDSSTTCTATLAPSSYCVIGVTFAPTAAAAYSGNVAITTSAGSQTVTLSGTGTPQIAISPATENYGNVVVNTSAGRHIGITNYQTTALTTSWSLSGSGFTIDPSTTCTATLAPSSYCVIGVTFTPTALTSYSGNVAITTSAGSQTVTLSGNGIAPLSISPSSLNFGNVAVGSTSTSKTVTVTNNQSVNLTFSSIIPMGPFTVGSGTCAGGVQLAPGSSCTIVLFFQPTVVGATSGGQVTITDSASNSPQVVTLSGTGLSVGTVKLNPTSLDFGPVAITNTVVKSVTLTNNLSVPLHITSITGFPVGFSLNGAATTCVPGTPVPAGSSCVVAISFMPLAVGSPSGTISVNDDANPASQTFTVGGTATAKLVPSPTSLAFTSQAIGTTSTSQSITLTNPQSVDELITGATITGPNASDFAVSSTTCQLAPVPQPAGSSCKMNVTFTPSGPGTRTATLTIGDPIIIPLTGAGAAPVTVLPGLLTYTSPVGATSAYQTVTITNASTTKALVISNLQLSGDFVQTSTNCGAAPPYTLAIGASCFLTISFNPSIGGVRDGQLQVYDDAVTSPQVINITGTGTSPLTLSPTYLNFSAQTINTLSTPKTFKLTNNETKSETFTLNATGDFTATSNCATGVIAAKSSCLIYVVFDPSSVTPTTRTGSLTVANTAPGGPVPTASLSGSAVATNLPPAVSVVSPGAGAAGTTISAVITGNTWTHFNASSVITFTQTDNSGTPCGIIATVPDTTTTTVNTINAQLAISGVNPIYGACDISVVTTLSGGGTETALLSMAFIIADPSNSHTITDISPNFGTQGQLSLNVNLTATGTSFVDGVTFANFGDGITVNSLSVLSPTTAQANITISNTTPIGYRTITLVTGGEYATSSATAFQIGPNSAALLSISPTLTPVTPTAEAQGWSGVVYLTASGTHFQQNATQVSFTGGILTPEVTVTSPTTAIVNVAVTGSATVGLQNATVWTGGEIASLNNAFTVTGATPALLGVAPSSGVQGKTLDVVITGNSFTTFPVGVYTNPAADPIVADLTGMIAVNKITVTSASSATVNITISPNSNIGSIAAKLTVSNGVGGATIFPFGFAITPSNAAITNVTPACVPQGGQMTLAVTGVNTVWLQGNTMAAFYPVPYENITVDKITITDPTNALLDVAVSTDTPAGTYGFYMVTGGQLVNSTINVCAATPTLTMSPANGLLPSGSAVNSFNVSFTGQFTHFDPGTLAVMGGEGVNLLNFNVTGQNSATATVQIIAGTNGTPTATGPRLVTLTTGGEIVKTYFNVTQTPVGIISVTPYHALPSTTTSVEIIGLNTNFTSTGANPTQVLFGPQITVVPGSIVVKSATDLTVSVTTSFIDNGITLPTPTGWQNIYVNTGTEQVMGGFLVDTPAQPTLVSVCVTGSVPCVSSARQGASVDVTITGSLTNWVQNTTEAILGAGVSVSNLQIINPNTATATIAVSPTAPVGGNSVIMITGSEIVSGTGFNVTPGGGSIFSVGPNVTCSSDFAAANVCGTSGGSGAPYVVSQLQTVVLNVVGVGTHWLQGETAFSFGPGVVIDSLKIFTPIKAQVEITVLSNSPVGFVPLTTTTDGEVVTLQQAIDIEEGFPAMLAISPNGQVQGDTLSLQVLGRYTNWQAGVTSAAFNRDITVNSVNVIDSDNLILNITISPLAYVDYTFPCGHILTITTGTVQVAGNAPPSGVAPSYFCVSQGAEEITNVSPNTFAQGTSGTVNITGSATDFQPGITSVSFGDSSISTGTVTVNSATSLSVPIAVSTSSTVGYHTVTVTTLGEVATQQYGFSVSPNVATLNEAIPNQAEQGSPLSTQPPLVVRLIGQYSHFSGQSTATFGAGIIVQSVAYVSNTEVDATITIDPLSYTGGRQVTVTTPGVSCAFQPTVATTNVTYAGCTPGSSAGTGSEIVTNNIFAIIPGPAIISQIAPATGNEGQEVVFNITGAFTHWAQNFTQFYIAGGGYDLTVNSVVINSPTSATVDLNIFPTANPGARSIYMVTDGEALTDSGAFVVTGGVPVITYVSPNSVQNNPVTGTTGMLVDIYGLYTNWAPGSTSIYFGPGITVSSFQVDNATHIETVLNIDPLAQLGWRTVQATTTGLPAGTQVLTGNFLVSAPAPPPTPYIWYASPGSGLPGQTFTITFYGSNTHWDPGAGQACSQSNTTLTGFNASVSVNCFQVLSPTSAIANVTIDPAATASVSNLSFTTSLAGGGTEVEYANFSVVVAQPILSVVDPDSGMQGSQNLVVNIIGKYTTFDSSTTFNFGSGITLNGPPTIIGPTIATQSISVGQLATLGYRSVVATTPDVVGSAQVVSGGYFYVSPSLALIQAVTPNLAKQGDTLTVDVTGQNTHWDGSTVFTFGAGIQVTHTQVNGFTDATLTISIPALASEGPTWVTATTLGEVANLNNGFVVEAGTPLLISTSPNSRPQQGSAVFTILSQATTWTPATPPTVSYGDGVVVTNVNVTSATSLTVSGYIQPTTNVGWRNVTVTSSTQVLGLNYALYVTPGPAVINSVMPSSAGQGQEVTVTITGTNTNWQSGVTTLTFPHVLINSWSVTSPTSITADITVNTSAPAGEESVTVTTGGEVSTGVNVFTVIQTQPELLSVVASSQVQGWNGTVSLTGMYTHFNTASGCSPNCTTINFGTGIIVNSVTANDSSHVSANITVQPTTTLGYRNVTVTTGAEAVSIGNAFNVTVGPAAIQGALNPSNGAQNSSLIVHVTGSQTHFLQGTTTASFGGGIQVTGVTVIDLLHADVAITIPSTTTLNFYDVSLTTNGEVARILGGFTVTSGLPVITVVSPPTGHQGDGNAPFYVNLTGLYTHFNTAPGCSPCSTASFGAGITVNNLTASNATHVVANITISPAAAIASRTISVTTGTETASITGGFSVLAGIPALVSATAGSAQAGTTANIVIVGQFTTFQPGFTSVSFGQGITVNFVTVNSMTNLTANITVAPNATVGSRDISVTTNSVPLTLSGSFNVTAGTPVITQISPNIGNPGQTNLTVTLSGQYTNWTSASTVTIGSASSGISVGGSATGTAGPVVTATATSLTVSLTIASGAPVGPVDVAVTTAGSTQTVPGGFTVQAASIPAPSLLSLSPGMNAGSTGPSGTVPINSSFTAVFSQPMNRTTFTSSTVLLYLTSNPNQGWFTVPTTINVDASGRVLTVTPNSLMAVNSQYYLNLTSGIKDATGNSFSSYGQYLYTSYTANSTPATVVAVNPPSGTVGVGTNVPIQIQFSTDMNQETQTGLAVSTSGGNVAGSYSWNSSPYGSPNWGPGTILTFTPTVPLAANTSYTVSWNAPLADTASNSVTPGSFTFTTGSGVDSAQNNVGADFASGITNVGTNFVPRVTFSKPINMLNINTGTLMVYNADSGKYVLGAVNVAPNGMSATFTPTYPLLPYTYYYLHMAWGNYDMDGNYLNGINQYFTTGDGSDLAPPAVASVSPADDSITVPLNAQIVAHFSEAIDPTSAYSITVTPVGGSPIVGTATLGSDQMTLNFVPTGGLQGATQFTVQVSGFSDLAGNTGATFSSTFTTLSSVTPLNVSTGLDASGNLITVGDTSDPHWFVNGTAANAKIIAATNTDWYSSYIANGPNSAWITANPDSSANPNVGDTLSTTFNWSGSTTNVCLVGAWGSDDWGTLSLNGTSLISNVRGWASLTPISISIDSYLIAGTNTLALTWVQTDGGHSAYRLQAAVQTCGVTLTGGLTLSSATPANGASNVSPTTTITLNFNNPIDPATVNSATLPVMVNWNSGQAVAGNYQVNGNQVVFTPDTPFPLNTQIWVGGCNGPRDLAGDSIGGCYTQLTYFNTATSLPPGTPAPEPFQIVAFTPAANATNVGLRTPVTATFNHSVNPGTINSSDFGLFNGDSQSPWCTSVSRSQDNTAISFNCGAMPSSAAMTAILTGGIQDWSGNALPNFTNHFTTTYYDSNTHGSVITERPGNGASGISANEPLTIFTNLPINAASANSGLEVAQNNVAVPGSVQVLDNGYALLFTPSSPWTPGALIQWWTTGSLTDTTYSTYFNSSSGYFTVAADTSAATPTVQVISPSNGNYNIALNTIYDVQFNTPLNLATVAPANIYLYDSSSGLHLAGTYSMPQANVVRIVPSSNFLAGRYIYLYINTGLQSATSVPAVNNNWYAYTGNPVDTTLPTITSAVPYNGATGVGVNIAPGVIFNKPIDPVSVNSTTFQVLQGAIPLAGSFWFNSNNTKVEFVPNAPLPANANLTMSLNGVLDVVGNPVTFTSAFQTGSGPDFTAPSVVWTTVSTNESIPINSSITVQFNESMDTTTFSSGNFYIYDNLLGTRIAATLSWSSDQSTGYLTPSSALAAGRQYYLNVNGGTDLAGNQVNGVSYYFYAEFTSATTAPTVINFNPLNGATGLGTNVIVEAQFSGPIDPTTLSNVTLQRGGVTVLTSPSLSAGNSVLQLVPNIPLAANTSYVMTIAGVKDPAGNTVATVSNSFQTGPGYDISNASVVTIDPPNNARVGTNTVPKLVFNKALNPITVNNSNFRMYLNDVGQWIPLTVTPSANGLQVTLMPQIPLLPYTEYYYQVCCSLQDQDGNSVNGGTWYFYTGDGANNTHPTVAVSPVDGAGGIPINARIRANVSAPIDPTSWSQSSIQMLDASSNPVAGTVSQPDNQTLVFTPASLLASSTTFTVNVSGFTDANGNTVTPSSTTFTTYIGTSASGTGFSVISSNIGNGASNISQTSQIILTFSQILDPATVNSSTLEIMDGWNSNRGLAGTYAVNGNQVTFTPSAPYPPGAQIYVGSCNGPVDILGDAISGCYNNLLYFNVINGTPDTTPLAVLSVSPANGATNVRHDQPVSVTFNKSIYNTSTGSYNTQLYAGQDLQTNGSMTMSSDGRTITFNVGALNNGTTYTIVIPSGGVSDVSGNTLVNNFISTFTTANNPSTGNGSVQSTTPGNTSGIPTNSLLTLFMNRKLNPATVPGSLTVTVNGQVYAGNVSTIGNYEIQFTPTVPFPYGAAVQWFLSSSVTDVDGNPFNSANGYFYIVGAPGDPAITQPQVVATSPYCCGSSNAPTNTVIDLQYNVPIDATTLNGNVYLNSGTAVPYTVALAPGTTNVVRITPTTAWAASTWYGFCANSSVKGTNGVAAQSDCWATYFTTTAATDTTSGTVAIGPPDGVVNVGTNAHIRLQFSKPVDMTTINTANVAITIGGVAVPVTWSYNTSNSDVVGANFYPINPLPPLTTIQVSASGLLDYAGNTFATATASFTTAAVPDFSTPSVTMDFPYGQTGIATNASFTCRYNEPIDPSSINSSGVFIWSYVTNARVPLNPYIFSSDLMAVTMTPTAPLFAGGSQYYYACYNAIDLTGNGQGNTNVYFYTGNGPSSAGPTLLYANPPNGMTNVAVNTNNGPWYGSSLGLLFNEPVMGGSLGNITLTPAGGSPIPIGVGAQYGNTIAWVQLPWALSPNTIYTYNITGVTDYDGNPMTPVTSTFTTGSSFDFTSPTVASTVPVNGAGSVEVTTPISITFSEAMDPILITSDQVFLRTHNTGTKVPAALSFSADYKTVYLSPTVLLAATTIYDLVINGNNWWPYDFAGNSFSTNGYVSYNSGYIFSTFTTGTPAAVNGVCGSASGGTFSAAPTANLCSAGTASAVTNTGSWSWTCNGLYGGTTASCSATVSLPNSCYPQQSGLVSWWKGDGDATDHMGNNNGTLENSASFALGEVGDAFSFNGSNQFVLIGQPVPTDLQIQNAFALSAWIYVTSYPANVGSGPYGTIVGSENGNTHSGIGLYLNGPVSYTGVPPGSLDLDIGNGSSWYSTFTTTQIPLNQWVLVTATATANNPAQIYYNGVLQPTMTPSGETVWNGTVAYTGSGFAIGQTVTANYSFNGLIDDVQVYNTNLTTAQIQGIYNAGSAGVCP